MIYLIRHGLDDESYIGGYSNVGLINLGVEQIEKSSKWLLEQRYDIKKIYSSDITRALESANIIAKYLNIPICVDSNLREQDKGILNGMKKEEAIRKYSDYLYTDDINLKYPDGESLKDLYLRVKCVLSFISDYDNSLLVTHRGVINMLYYLTCNDLLDMNKGRYDVVHGSVHEFDIKKVKIRRIK